jgi:hypothetical protein
MLVGEVVDPIATGYSVDAMLKKTYRANIISYLHKKTTVKNERGFSLIKRGLSTYKTWFIGTKFVLLRVA